MSRKEIAMSSKTNKGKTRKAKSRRKRLERRLVAYAVSAGATAAVSGQAAEAKIVYTEGPFPYSGFNTSLDIDFNGDSTAEFQIHDAIFGDAACSYAYTAVHFVLGGPSNHMHVAEDGFAQPLSINRLTSALRKGDPIGPPSPLYNLGGLGPFGGGGRTSAS